MTAFQVRTLCILLVLQAVVSYRSVPRVLHLFASQTPLIVTWIPHFTSVINWTLRLGLGLLKQVSPINKPWLAIIDHSIDIGTKKALVVLRVSLDALSKSDGAITLKECECIGLTVSEVVNGDTISQQLKAIFDQSGTPSAIIKDGDYTLQKGVRLWSDTIADDIPVIDDIGHVMATALKKQYQNDLGYQRFTSLVSKAGKKLRQTVLAFLSPPKLRTKGRFQSIGRLGKWGKKVLEVLSPKKEHEEVELLDKLREALPDLDVSRPFIEQFASTAKVVSDSLCILKNTGLTAESYKQCYQLSDEFDEDSVVKPLLQDWLKRQFKIQQQLTKLPLLVSSDIIESLFGRFKHVIERSPQADMNRTTLLIPALCGSHDKLTVEYAFKQVRHHDLSLWESENISYTMRKKRQEFFLKKIHKVGSILG